MSKPIEIDLTNQGDRAPAFGTALSSADADQAASRLAPDGLQSTGAWRCGHPRTPENTKIVQAGKGTACKACFRELNRNYMRAKRAAKADAHD